MPERSRGWFDQAARDLESARWQAEGGYCEWACFVAQQAAEKAIKAVYQKLAAEAWGHSVAGLLEGLRGRTQVSEELAECGSALDRFYIPARDPNSWDRGAPREYFSQEDADGAIGCAERVLRFCDGLLAGGG
jgi:HEPN domain-containing protein